MCQHGVRVDDAEGRWAQSDQLTGYRLGYCVCCMAPCRVDDTESAGYSLGTNYLCSRCQSASLADFEGGA